MHTIMVAGAGKIGSLIACLLADSQAYQVHLADISLTGRDVSRLLHAMPAIKTVTLDITDETRVAEYLQHHAITAVISSLPFFINKSLARAAKRAKTHYFDLTEDTTVATFIQTLAKDATTAFVPRCGLAPGFIGIVANHLIQTFEEPKHAKLRVGALPQHTSNALQYALTWSTDGLINEYINDCQALVDGHIMQVKALEDLEIIHINDATYEAFNTSGGLGGLSELYRTQLTTLNYKTLRYPGHCEKMRFLLQDLKLSEDRATLKQILEKALPHTAEDIVVCYVSVEGIQEGEFSEKSYVHLLYPKDFYDLHWSAIQASTASGVCAVVDLVLQQEYSGFVLQETLPLADILSNHFGQYFRISA